MLKRALCCLALFQIIIAITSSPISGQDEHSVAKRHILPKYKNAALAFSAIFLGSGKKHRGKRDTSAFERPSLKMLQYMRPIEQQQFNMQSVQQNFGQAVSMQQQQPTATVAPIVQNIGQPASMQQQQQQQQQPEQQLQNTCTVGMVEPIYEGQVITETYCRCPSGTYGLDCQENFVNPCVENGRQYHQSMFGPNYFIECNWNIPYVFKCPRGLLWNQQIETCDWPFVQQNVSQGSSQGATQSPSQDAGKVTAQQMNYY